MEDLTQRTGLPDALRVLAEGLPRSGWETHPNFSALTRFWLDRHLMFRDILKRLLDDTEARLDTRLDPHTHAEHAARLAGFLLEQLHTHHRVEDHHYFPQLNRLDARLIRGFELLDADHGALDGLIHGLGGAVRGYLDAEAAEPEAARLLKTLDAFRRHLDRHLTDEEDLIVPVILTYAPDLR